MRSEPTDRQTTVHPTPRAGDIGPSRFDDAQRQRMLGDLVRRYNHDARTPLNTILGWTHLLQQPGAANRLAHGANVIARNTGDQMRLLDEFVDDARVLLRVLTLPTATIRAADVIDGALAGVADVAQLQSVTLTTSVAIGEVSLRGELPRLQRLLQRLLLAIVRRATADSSVTVTAHRDDQCLAFQLRTESAGSDWSEAALLELQLATLHAELHEGQLEIDSAPGRAALVLRLPVA